ncbi:hypothetical protein PVAND_016948 [Polypedilum vanderplanki]|uniref:Uncharacterized protein n=1 Tax=Polypedilum vanderplanki TaxID=319348 RepID=A0A9J6BHJ6_POLVA|nr:hypothetical protein PVAND_016948 [Polypedilum vanderplanki]
MEKLQIIFSFINDGSKSVTLKLTSFYSIIRKCKNFFYLQLDQNSDQKASTKIEKLFQFFILKYQFFGLWPASENQSKYHKVMIISAILLLSILPTILMLFRFTQKSTIEEFMMNLLFAGAFVGQFIVNFRIRFNRQKMVNFVKNFLETVIEQQLAVPYIFLACDKAQKLVNFMTALILITINVQMIVMPLAFGILPIPIFQSSWTVSGIGFGFLWLYELLFYNFAFLTLYNILFSFVIVMLMTAYAEYLSSELQELSSGSGWMNGYKELINCIQIHIHLKKQVDFFLNF